MLLYVFLKLLGIVSEGTMFNGENALLRRVRRARGHGSGYSGRSVLWRLAKDGGGRWSGPQVAPLTGAGNSGLPGDGLRQSGRNGRGHPVFGQ